MEYNKLKETNVIWIPYLPTHWDMIKVRHLFKESTIKGFPDEPLLVASQEHGVVNKEVFGKRTMEATKDFHLLKLVEKGDFVISLRSFQGGIELAHERGIISPAYTILKEKRAINKFFFKHLFKSKPFISLLTLCVKGIREGQNIDIPTFKGEYLPLPPIEEQKGIGEYLNRKTQQIQNFILKKEQLINTLNEKINYLVNDDQNWRFEKAKWVFDEIKIKNQISEELLAVTQDRGVIPKRLCEENFVSPDSYEGLKLVDKGDFVISLRSFQGGIEFSEYRGIVSPAYNIIRLKPAFNNTFYTRFFRYYFKSPKLISLLNTIISGIRDGKNINWDDFKNILVPIPKETTIKNMLVYFDKLESLKSQIKIENKKLLEYQDSLITQIVTGQLKVPDRIEKPNTK